MRKKTLFICCFLLISFSGISQENNSQTVDDQISELIEKSNTYQSYKVIELNKLRVLQRNIRDSISVLKTSIATSESVILEQNNKIDSITNQIEDLNLDLAKTQDKVENISLLGIPTNKSTYNTIMWSIVIVLLLISSILFFRFKKSHGDTKDAREKLEETEVELENLRKRSLEREQKVRRQLQDEINKNKLRRE
ncbi:MAG TPA: hypothetical protein VK050_10965 [Flavobacteriaceae bacterium]|nr:hypothetical protein [Flavobacteriaceae bacterium]